MISIFISSSANLFENRCNEDSLQIEDSEDPEDLSDHWGTQSDVHRPHFLDDSELETTKFTFSSPLPSYPKLASPSLKRDSCDPNAPTPPSSPSKKRTRVTDQDLVPDFAIDPIAFSNISFDEVGADPLTSADHHSDPFGGVPDNLSTDVPPSAGPDWEFEREGDLNYISDNDDVPIAPKPSEEILGVERSSKPKGKITLYWRFATKEEKEDQDQRDFQRVADEAETMKMNGELIRQRKLTRQRAEVRERVQICRERQKEKKIEDGWVPRQKRVSCF